MVDRQPRVRWEQRGGKASDVGRTDKLRGGMWGMRATQQKPGEKAVGRHAGHARSWLAGNECLKLWCCHKEVMEVGGHPTAATRMLGAGELGASGAQRAIRCPYVELVATIFANIQNSQHRIQMPTRCRHVGMQTARQALVNRSSARSHAPAADSYAAVRLHTARCHMPLFGRCCCCCSSSSSCCCLSD